MSLQTFRLGDLAQFTHEGVFGPTASPDFRVFYVGRDNVHGVLHRLLQQVSLSLKMNMFSYDDDDLNQCVFKLAMKPTVFTQITLDLSQSANPHETRLLASDAAQDPVAYAADFAVGESPTHQISHTKGGVLDGVIAFEGSTNWSGAGQGTGINLASATQLPSFKAQNNTLIIYTNPYEIARFSTRLDYEHAVARAQQSAREKKP